MPRLSLSAALRRSLNPSHVASDAADAHAATVAAATAPVPMLPMLNIGAPAPRRSILPAVAVASTLCVAGRPVNSVRCATGDLYRRPVCADGAPVTLSASDALNLARYILVGATDAEIATLAPLAAFDVESHATTAISSLEIANLRARSAAPLAAHAAGRSDLPPVIGRLGRGADAAGIVASILATVDAVSAALA